MKNYLPPSVGIALLKSEFCFCAGISPYYFRLLVQQHSTHLAKLGYNKWQKLLPPAVVLYLCEVSGLRIDVDLYAQVKKQRFAYYTY